MEIYHKLFSANVSLKRLAKAMVDRIPKGTTLGAGTESIADNGGVYLLSNGIQRLICDTDAMKKYSSNQGCVHTICFSMCPSI